MKVVTFGEIMLRLFTPGYLRFNQTVRNLHWMFSFTV